MKDKILIKKTVREDFLNIQLQTEQFIPKDILESYDFTDLISQPSWTLINENNDILFIGGLVKIHNKRLLLWSFISKNAGKYMLFITRKTKDIISQYKDIRLETNVSENFINGHKWAKILGFKFEAILECYAENGNNMAMYSIINKGF